MSLEFHSRKKSAPTTQLSCRQLAERWGSTERVAASAGQAQLPASSAFPRLLVVGMAGLGILAAAVLILVKRESGGSQTTVTVHGGAGTLGSGDPLVLQKQLSSGQAVTANATSGGQPLSLGDIIKRTEDSVVKINALAKSGQQQGFGSGFIVDARGWVATNYHVIRTAAKVQVQFRDGKTADVAGVVGQNEGADLAVLALSNPPPGLRAIPLNTTPPQPGDTVFSVGHPQGLSFSVTTGNVGAVRRTAEFPPQLTPPNQAAADTVWVQSNAAIAGGSSGGPLCDSQGRVIGVNSWLAIRENYAFAVHVAHLDALVSKPLEKLAKLPADRPVSEVDDPLAALEPRVQAMWQEFYQAEREFQFQLVRARTPAERDLLIQTKSPRPKYAERFLQIAEAQRKTLTGFQAFFSATQMYLPGTDATNLVKALDRLAEDHMADRGLHRAFRPLADNRHDASAAFLARVIQQSPHRQVQGAACFHLARLFVGQGKPEARAEALKLLERCGTEFAEVKIENGTLGQLAAQETFRVRFLTVGATAQDIQGADIDGKPLRLSDFRGKVVLLDFFADWCPHCAEMYPHEQKLVKQYAGKPFVLLGVNGDTPDTLKQLIDSGRITWRCWSDGGNGPIAQQWQISAIPTLFLIDAKGVIRQTFQGRPREKQLEEAIAALVAETEKESAKTSQAKLAH